MTPSCATATAADGQRALNDMCAALAQGYAITAAINNNALYDSGTSNANYTNYNHQIQVLKVDNATGKIWVNDSALESGGTQFSLSTFMKSWQVSNYDLTVVSANPV